MGAGASAEAGAPVVRDFQRVAREVASSSDGEAKRRMDLVLGFWLEKLRSFNVEEFFGFVDSESLRNVTREGQLTEMRSNTLFLISKVITQRLAERLSGGRSKAHVDFAAALDPWAPILTLNWDILLDNALLEQRRNVSYALPGHRDLEPQRRGSQSQVLLKLHGSLNWLWCRSCGSVNYLREKEDAVRFQLGMAGEIACWKCSSEHDFEVLLVPPVLSKLEQGGSLVEAVWSDAFGRLRDARHIVIVGYSFPPADIQTKLFISKALGEADKLESIEVVTRPKFGSTSSQFEDRYVEALKGSEKVELLNFNYERFGKYAEKLREKRGR